MCKLKVLRSLVLIKLRYDSNWNMRVLVRSLFRLIPDFGKLILTAFCIYIFFGLILTKVYKNDGYFCDNPYTTIKTKEDCYNWGGDWVESRFSFTNILNSVLNLIFISSMEGWSSIMALVMNFNGKDKQPVYNANQHIQIFFIIFFFLGNLIILNSFISISLTNFKKIKEK